MAAREIHPWFLRELVVEVANPLSIILEKFWQSGEKENWKRRNIDPVFTKGNKEDLGNHRAVSLTSLPSKVMEQILLETVLTHMGYKGMMMTDTMTSLRANSA